MEEDFGTTALTEAQSFLFDLCQKDLQLSVQRYRTSADPHHGQQVLADLKRMQNIIHKHLSLPGDTRWPMANVFIISQVLTSILRNPDGYNLCFGNAPFRSWCWTGAFAEDAYLGLGPNSRSHPPVSLKPGPSIAPMLANMDLIWEHFEQGSQADASDFLGFLWEYASTSFYGSKFFHWTLSGQLEEREQMPLNVLFLGGASPVTLDELINDWADEEGGQFLFGAPDALVLQLQRFQLKDGTWTKHDRELDLGTEINIPFSEDGNHIHQAVYRIVSLVLHQGAGHQNGHYQTVLLMDNAMWLADDEAYPVPLNHLSPQQRREILQIWLVKEPEDELVEDTQEAYQAPVAKKQTAAHETLHLLLGNVTQYGAKVQDWIWTKPDTMLFFQETHMGEKETSQAVQYYSTRGWKAYGIPAHPTGQGGTTGGFLTLHSTRHLTHQAQYFTDAGNGWTSIGLQRDNFQVFIIQIYLRTGETLQSTGNSLILSHLLAYLHHLKAPFIIGGDWQNDPEALAATVIQSKFKAAILDTGGSATLQGSQLDFLLVSNSLVGSLQVKASWEVPWKPHCAIEVSFDCTQPALAVQQLQRFPPIGRTFQLPHPWTSFPETDGPFWILNERIDGLGSDLARWATQTEQYITQLLHKPVTGRGSNISLLQAPLVDSTTSRTWMRGAVAFWEKLNVRINVVHHTGHKRVLRDLSQMMVDVHRYGSDDFQADLFLAILQQWLQSPAKDPAELKAIVLEQEQKAQKQALYSTSLEYQEWLSKARKKGLGILFRSLRLRDQAWQRPFQSLPAPERIRAREHQWGEIWVPLQAPVQIRGLEHLRVLAPRCSKNCCAAFQTKRLDRTASPTTC